MQDAAAHGKDIAKMPLHVCGCHKCFSQSTDLRGRITCEPACDLDKCNLITGACSGGGGGSASLPLLTHLCRSLLTPVHYQKSITKNLHMSESMERWMASHAD